MRSRAKGDYGDIIYSGGAFRPGFQSLDPSKPDSKITPYTEFFLCICVCSHILLGIFDMLDCSPASYMCMVQDHPWGIVTLLVTTGWLNGLAGWLYVWIDVSTNTVFQTPTNL